MKYGIHPSKKLVQLYSEKPFQGQKPEDSKIIFLGNDANYSPEISEHIFFKRILEYHSDGVEFWKRTGKHHPFMLNEYPFKRSEGGVPYHRRFSSLGFGKNDAENFTFVELLNVPTIGNTEDNVFLELLDKEHLQWLESLIFTGNKQFVVISQRLVRYVRLIHRKFNVLGDLVHRLKGAKAPSIVLESQNVILYYGFSLSAAKPNSYFKEFASDIQEFLINTSI